jgi:hypothetical protein
MKKIILTAGVVSLSMVFFACGGGSKKGAWQDSDKKEFSNACIDRVKDLEAFNEQQRINFCDCVVKKAEQQFEDLEECGSNGAADEQIGKDCAVEILNQK